MEIHAQEVMEEFVEGLKETYIERQLSCEEQWPLVSAEKLVNLQLVEAKKKEGFRAGLPQHGAHDEKVKRTPILHGDLFKVEEGKKPVRKLIVEGNAGIGKTTLCTMLTEQWANGEILTQFDCVLLLPLRERSVSTATTLPQLFKLLHSSERIRTSVIEELEEREGEGVLIIGDGWDELDQENQSQSSFLYNLLFIDILPFVSVLLTSRPSASAPLHDLPTVDRLVEVVGFNEENVKQYIESEFDRCPEKASSLIEQLENNPVIQSVCSVPLNCAIVCNLWHTLDRALPKTLTELYVQVVVNVVFRNLKKQNLDKGLISLSFDSIPRELCDMFWLMCEFAFESLVQDKIVFSQEELVSSFPTIFDSTDKIMCLGLLQCARSLLPVGHGLSIHFIHLTIQEFLAALHLVTLSSEEKLKVCEAHALRDRFEMVWRFMFGLVCKKTSSYSRKVVCLDDKVIDHFLSIFRYNGSYVIEENRNLMLCHCSIESLNDTVSSQIAKKINGSFQGYSGSIAHSPHDCVAVFNVLCHTSHCTDMTINLSRCGLTDKLLKELTDILSSAGGALQVRELSLYDNKVTDKGVNDLFTRAIFSFDSLIQINLSGNSITDLTPLLPICYYLHSVDLSDNPLGVSGILSLETAVQAGVLDNLIELGLSNTLTDDADINGALLATLFSSIASHCLELKKLNLSRNIIHIPGARALGELNLLCKLKMLDVSDVNIEAEALTELITAINLTKSTISLTLSNNPLGYNGLLAILNFLCSETCPVTSLDLSNTDLTTPVNTESQCHNIQPPNTDGALSASTSCQVFENNSLTTLCLDNNNFSGNGIRILAECMLVCKSLEWLYCWRCLLTSSEVIILLDNLKGSGSSHRSLFWWHLDYNSINDEGVSALIESVPELFLSLESVGLNDNPVSDESKKRLKKLLLEQRLDAYAKEVAEEEATVLTEWERTCVPPQSEQQLQVILFDQMWTKLLEELAMGYGILDHPTVQSVDSHYQCNLVVCEDVPAGGDPQPLEPSSTEGLGESDDDDESFHSATEELDEPMRTHPTATDESTPPTVQSPHRMDQQETMSGDGTVDVTTPSPHGTLSGVCGLETVTIEELKNRTKVTDSQLDTEIDNRDMILLAKYFNINVETLSVQLGLTPADQKHVSNVEYRDDTQTAVDKALRLWRRANPGAATYRALVETVLRMGVNGTPIAEEVCKFSALKSSSQEREQSSK